MSFSSLEKNEIIQTTPRSACCRRAMLFGILAVRGDAVGDTVTLTLESRKSAEYASGTVSELYGASGEVWVDSKGGRRVFLRFKSKSLSQRLSSFSSFDAFVDKRCPSCEAHYLRGIFFAAGKLADPASQYSLEFSPKERCEKLAEYFSNMGLSPKIREKSGQKNIYFRNSTEIEDFLAAAGMNSAVFSIMNTKIENELRNNVNRVVNCDTRNIGKIEKAAEVTNGCIGYLIKNDLCSLLSEELLKTAMLRYENPELSLSNLAQLHTPPITKPGLSHRLKKIVEITAEAKKKRSLGKK